MTKFIVLAGVLALPGGWSNHPSQNPQAGGSTASLGQANRSGDIERAPAKVTGRGGVTLSGRPRFRWQIRRDCDRSVTVFPRAVP